MPKVLEGELTANNLKFAIVVARFNDFLTSKLLDGALDTIRRHGGNPDDVTVAWVPGSFEIPIVAKRLAESGEFDAVICIGCVIRGATGHYDHVAGEASGGIAQAGMDTGVPVIFGMLTAESIEQAIERTGTKQGNSGSKAAITAIEMANLMQALPGAGA